MRRWIAALLVLVAATACGQEKADPDKAAAPSARATAADTSGAVASTATSEPAGEQRHPDIVEVELEPAGDRTFDVRVTVSSPYDTPQRYADGWRVVAPDGTELGTHMLAHDHAGEQPFTRTQSGVAIPESVDEVTVEGRDQQYGFGGQTRTVDVPR